MSLDQALETFVGESRELLAEMEEALLNVGHADDPADAVHAIFRAAHTIKGSAGLFGLVPIVDFTHVVESVLERVREGTIALDAELVALMLSCNDCIGRLVEQVVASGEPDAALAAQAQALVKRLEAYLPQGVTSTQAAAPDSRPAATPGAAGHWHISLRFQEGVLRNGMDPLSFLRYLQRLGRITGVACQTDQLPALADMDPEACYLGLEIGLDSSADRATIEGTFEFVRDDCAIRILPPGSSAADYLALIDALGEDPMRASEMLVQCGSVTRQDIDAAVCRAQGRAPGSSDGHPVTPEAACGPVSDAASDKPRQRREQKSQEGQSIRIDAAKLDHLIDLVGELITAAAGASLAAARSGNAELQECTFQVESLVESVRHSTLQLRMVKIGATFNRFRRVVHDVSRALGKDISLVVRGEDTELDKTVVEKIADPLTHLVRNAMDHGIEPAHVRATRGKPAHGTITLDARHDSGHIVIEVSDDGGGLDRERILAKARERGLIEDGRDMSDADVYKLIFEPGFSTAAQVTDLSGRGVGMDVVRRNIEALRGSVHVASTPGQGTTVTVRLPLTLAIIDGFLVGVGKSRFVLPLDMVDECVAYANENGHNYMDLRGKVLPFIRLREMFDLPGSPASRENIVVVNHAGLRIGLVVDALLGETQVVIKPLSRIFKGLRGIAGSSILGSGEVALILDVPALMEQAASDPKEHPPETDGPQTPYPSPDAMRGQPPRIE